MEKINITIPDNLNESQEVFAIAKQLSKKMLPLNKKLIGTSYDIKHTETQINIKRESVEKPIKTCTCSVCGTMVETKLSLKLWVNYGGVSKQRKYCSENCRENVIELVGINRAAINKKDLGFVWAW